MKAEEAIKLMQEHAAMLDALRECHDALRDLLSGQGGPGSLSYEQAQKRARIALKNATAALPRGTP